MSTPADHDSEFQHDALKSGKGWRPFLIRWGVISGILLVGIALLLPASRTARPATRRLQCANHLRQISLALHAYEERCGALPPAYTVDSEGMPLHSWRTLILPFLDQEDLYQSIDLSRPWNDPVNAEAFKTATPFYRCTEAIVEPHSTTYLAIVAPGSCFLPDQPRRLAEITDGTANTLMVIEVDDEHAVPWMAPVDADEAIVLSIGKTKGPHHAGGMNAGFVDGSVRFLSNSLPAAVRRAMISIAGHEQVRVDEY